MRDSKDQSSDCQELRLQVQNLTEEKRRLERSLEDARIQLRELRRYDNLRQRIIDLIPDVVCYIDRTHRYRLANKSYERLFGFQRSQVVGKRPQEVLGAEAYGAVAERHRAVLEGEAQDFTTSFRLPAGNRCHFHARYYPHVDLESGRVEGFLAVVEDITPRQEAKEALRESESRYRNLVENLPGTAYQFTRRPDGSFAFSYIGDNCEALFGLRAGEIMGDAAMVFERIPEPDISRVREAISSSAEKLQPYKLEHRYIHQDGRVRWIFAASTPRRQQDGSIVWDGVGLDVTERRSAVEALEKAFAALRQRERIANLLLSSEADQVFSEILDLILEEYQAEYGYLGYLDENGDLVCLSMTEAVWEACRVTGKSIVFPQHSWGGAWGESLQDRRSIRRNQGLGPPDGHVELHNTLIMPLLAGSQLIGQIALANNRTGSFTEADEIRLRTFADFLAPTLKSYLDKARFYQRLQASVTKLEETNIALKVMIDNRDEEKYNRNALVMEAFEKLVFPYFRKINRLHSRDEILALVEVLERNTRESLRQLERGETAALRFFSPRERQVADLIRAGHSSKQIAELLHLSTRAVFFHRNSIRQKLGISGTGENLQNFLIEHFR